MPGSTATPRERPDLDARYGRTGAGRNRTLVVAAVAALVLAALGWFAWASYGSAAAATGSDVGYQVVDDQSVLVTFDVTKAKDRTAVCTVQALDSGFGVVGTVDVTVGPATQGVVRRTVTVRTTNRAVTGRVEGCTAQH